MSDEDDILAAEHALGLSDAAGRMAADADFARAVDRWRERLLPMMGADEKAPPAALWTRIAGTLPANETVPAPPRPAGNGWRIGAFAASAVAAVLLGIVVIGPGGAPLPAPISPPVRTAALDAPQVMVAALMPERGEGAVSVTFDGREGRMTVMPMKMEAPAGKAPQLWILPAKGAPQSLGVIPDRAPATMLVAAGHRRMLATGVMLAVSLEPVGGSPTGLPTGPVVMKGKMQLV